MDLYVGLEGIQNNQGYQNFRGRGIFKTNMQEAAAYAGFNVFKYLGIELGYNINPGRKKTGVLTGNNNSTEFSVPLGDDSILTKSIIKITAPYLGIYNGLDYEFSNGGRVYFSTMVGVALLRVMASYQQVIISGVVPDEPDIQDFTKTRYVPVLKFSAVPMITKHIGMRVSVTYKNLSTFKARANQNGIVGLRMKDSIGLGLGLQYSI